jgi:hypothetical protein
MALASCRRGLEKDTLHLFQEQLCGMVLCEVNTASLSIPEYGLREQSHQSKIAWLSGNDMAYRSRKENPSRRTAARGFVWN